MLYTGKDTEFAKSMKDEYWVRLRMYFVEGKNLVVEAMQAAGLKVNLADHEGRDSDICAR